MLDVIQQSAARHINMLSSQVHEKVTDEWLKKVGYFSLDKNSFISAQAELLREHNKYSYNFSNFLAQKYHSFAAHALNLICRLFIRINEEFLATQQKLKKKLQV